MDTMIIEKDNEKRQVVVGNLPLDRKYTLIDIEYNEEIETCCQNCGKLIKNVYILKNDTGQTYQIGSECQGNLLFIGSPKEKAEIERKFRQFKSIIRKLKKAENITVCKGEFMYWLYNRDVNKWDVNFICRMSHEYFNKKFAIMDIVKNAKQIISE